MSRLGSPRVSKATTSVRVIHVAPTVFGPAGLFGGGERYPLELARALSSDVECELVSFAPFRNRYTEPGGLRCRTLRAVTFLHGHPAHPVAFALPAALAGADIIHTHHLRSASSRVAAVTARFRGQRVVVTDHGLQGSTWAGLLPKLFDRFLAVSAYSTREFGLPPNRTRVIYGGADPFRFSPDPAERRQGVLFVGRLTPSKGIDRLIEALPPGATLRIAGSAGHDPDPPERDYPALLHRLADGRDVDFLGPVPDSDLPALYRQAAVLTLPSVDRTCYGRYLPVTELLGLVLLEAMASGTPVVGSRLGAFPEVIQHGITGFLVEPGNVAELRERLAELLHDPERARWMGRNARDLVLERFTWRACADRCLAVYSELLAPTES